MPATNSLFFFKLELTQKFELLVSLQKIITSGHIGWYFGKFLQPTLKLSHLNKSLLFPQILWVSRAVFLVWASLASLHGHLGLDGPQQLHSQVMAVCLRQQASQGSLTWSQGSQEHQESKHQC